MRGYVSGEGRQTVVCVVIVIAIAVVAVALIASAHLAPPFAPRFDGNGLVTNETAYHDPDRPGGRFSPDWEVTAGSLFAREGAGWTGVPDNVKPNAESGDGTGSAVYRMVSRRRDFGNAVIRAQVRLQGFVGTATTPAEEFDGINFWVRYHNPQELYAVSVARRDNKVVIKRKTPGGPSNGGTYTDLGSAHHPYARGWMWITIRVVNRVPGQVELTLEINDKRVLRVVDRAPGGLTAPGGIGIRGDNTQFVFRSFKVGPQLGTVAPEILRESGVLALLTLLGIVIVVRAGRRGPPSRRPALRWRPAEAVVIVEPRRRRPRQLVDGEARSAEPHRFVGPRDAPP